MNSPSPSSPSFQSCELFSSRDSLEEALAYATPLIATIPPEHRMAATTALWVTLNTATALLAKSNLAEVQPFGEDEKHPDRAVSEIPPAEAARCVRSMLIRSIILGFKLERVNPDLGEAHSIFTFLVARMFDLQLKDILAEASNYIRPSRTSS